MDVPDEVLEELVCVLLLDNEACSLKDVAYVPHEVATIK